MSLLVIMQLARAPAPKLSRTTFGSPNTVPCCSVKCFILEHNLFITGQCCLSQTVFACYYRLLLSQRGSVQLLCLDWEQMPSFLICLFIMNTVSKYCLS